MDVRCGEGAPATTQPARLRPARGSSTSGKRMKRYLPFRWHISNGNAKRNRQTRILLRPFQLAFVCFQDGKVAAEQSLDSHRNEPNNHGHLVGDLWRSFFFLGLRRSPAELRYKGIECLTIHPSHMTMPHGTIGKLSHTNSSTDSRRVVSSRLGIM